jgi:hypothetical protein
MVLLLSYLLSALAWTALHPAAGTVSARKIDRNHIQALRRHAADRLTKNRLAVPAEGGVRLSQNVKNLTFSNPAASGTYLPVREGPLEPVVFRATVLTGGHESVLC